MGVIRVRLCPSVDDIKKVWDFVCLFVCFVFIALVLVLILQRRLLIIFMRVAYVIVI